MGLLSSFLAKDAEKMSNILRSYKKIEAVESDESAWWAELKGKMLDGKKFDDRVVKALEAENFTTFDLIDELRQMSVSDRIQVLNAEKHQVPNVLLTDIHFKDKLNRTS
jgi:hypothetical protein